VTIKHALFVDIGPFYATTLGLSRCALNWQNVDYHSVKAPHLNEVIARRLFGR